MHFSFRGDVLVFRLARPKGGRFHAPLPCILPLSCRQIPHARARRHSSRQRKKAKHIFANQGIVVPIIVDASHRIIDGVLRFEVTKDLGLEHLHAIGVHSPRLSYPA